MSHAAPVHLSAAGLMLAAASDAGWHMSALRQQVLMQVWKVEAAAEDEQVVLLAVCAASALVSGFPML